MDITILEVEDFTVDIIKAATKDTIMLKMGSAAVTEAIETLGSTRRGGEGGE